MKKLFTLIFLLQAIIFFSACKKDKKAVAENNPCQAVVCENGGNCNNGACDCPEGFSGPRCETYYTYLLVGSYKGAGLNCSSMQMPGGDMVVNVDPNDRNRLILSNGVTGFTAFITGNTFTLEPKSQLGLTIWGEGYFEGNKLSINLNYGSSTTGPLGNCSGEFYK